MTALALGSTALSAMAADKITSLNELSNNAVYTITRTASVTRGGGLLHSVDGSAQLEAGSGATETDASARWSIHYSPQEKAYFIYNLKEAKFAAGNASNKAVLSENAAEGNAALVYHDASKSWLIDCGGYALGLAADNNGEALFFDDLKNNATTRNLGFLYNITPVDGVTLTDAEAKAIEDKVIAGRAAALEKYNTFVTRAHNMANSTNVDYKKVLGLYDIEALEYALAHVDEYSLNEIEDIYQQALLSRYPKEGHFYRIHFDARPNASKWINNATRTTESGQLTGENFNKWGFGTATEGFSDDLGLFRFWYNNGDPRQVKVQVSAFGEYLTECGNNAAPGRTTDPTNAGVFTLDTKSTTARSFILGQSNGTWLTMGNSQPPHTVVAWNVKENSMYFYLEPVEEIEVPVDANGYASVCVPCGVTLPDGAKAYTVTSVMNGKAYVEEISGPIHQNVPFIVKAAAGAASVKLNVENTVRYIATEMAGTARVIEAPGRYVPVYSANGISFTYAEPGKVTPGSIYIVSDNVGELSTVMGANPESAIEEIDADTANTRELFDLQGRKVAGTPLPGLYINAANKRVVRIK